jgi:hypothetical protein
MPTPPCARAIGADGTLAPDGNGRGIEGWNRMEFL